MLVQVSAVSLVEEKVVLLDTLAYALVFVSDSARSAHIAHSSASMQATTHEAHYRLAQYSIFDTRYAIRSEQQADSNCKGVGEKDINVLQQTLHNSADAHSTLQPGGILWQECSRPFLCHSEDAGYFE
jgi:hypothetical protein